MALKFRQMTYGKCTLLVVTDEAENGVVIPKTKFLGRKLVPILVNNGNISEFAGSWTGLRKALFENTSITDFKKALSDFLNSKDSEGKLLNEPLDEGKIEFDELNTVYIKKGQLEPQTFNEVFFNDPRHFSTAQYRGEKSTNHKEFPTARGSGWLFKALQAEGYTVVIESFSFR